MKINDIKNENSNMFDAVNNYSKYGTKQVSLNNNNIANNRNYIKSGDKSNIKINSNVVSYCQSLN